MDTGSAYVSVPVPVLTDFSAQNPHFVLEIRAPYGSYLIPASLPDLIPGWEEMLEENGWLTENISFRRTLTEKTESTRAQAAVVLLKTLETLGLID